MKKILTILILLFVTSNSYAAVKVTAQSGAWSETSTWVGGVLPINTDSVVISSGHQVLMDVDTSGFSYGIQGVRIEGGSENPGMLYFKNGTSGYLKIRTNYIIEGTTIGQRGRLLANADGDWTNTAPLANEYKAVISTGGSINENINGENLDIRLLATQPTIPYTYLYKDRYDIEVSEVTVDVANNRLTLGVTPPADGTGIMFLDTDGELPNGIVEGVYYWIANIVGNTFQISTYSTYYPVDLKSIGSGTISFFTGFGTASTTWNVLDDLTSDPTWSNTTSYNEVILQNDKYSGTTAYLNNILSTQLTFSTSVDVTVPRLIFNMSRNVRIYTSGASSVIIELGESNHQHSIFNCLFHSYSSTTVTAIHGGSNYNFNGIIGRIRNGIDGSRNANISGFILLLFYDAIKNVNDSNISTFIFGAGYNTYIETGGIVNSNRNNITSIIIGCYQAICQGNNNIINGKIIENNFGIRGGFNNIIKGDIIMNVMDILILQSNITLEDFSTSTNINNLFMSAKVDKNCNIYHPVTGFSNLVGSQGGSDSVFYTGQTNGNNYYASSIYGNGKIILDGGIDGEQEFLNYSANVRRIVCDPFTSPWPYVNQDYRDKYGYPSVDYNGTNGECLMVYNLVYWNYVKEIPITILKDRKIWVPTGSHTLTYYLQNTLVGNESVPIAEGDLTLTCRYIQSAENLIHSEVSSSPIVLTRTSPSDWSQSISVSFVQATDGYVEIDMEWKNGTEGDTVSPTDNIRKLFVTPTPVITTN